MRRLIVALLVWIGFAVPVSAAPQAAQVPADAILYIGFAGTESLGPSYSGSHLQNVIKASQFAEFYRQVLPQVLERTLAKDPQGATQMAQAASIGEVVGRRGFAFYLCEEPMRGTSPELSCGFVCDAGADAESLEKWAHELAGPAKPDSKLKTQITRSGSLVRMTIDETPRKLGLDGAPAFKSSLQHVNADPLVMIYFDAERAMGIFDKSVRANPQDQTPMAVVDALGIRALKRVVMTGGLAGANFSTRSFVEAPQPRSGLLSLWDQGAVDATLLQKVPANATSLQTLHLNLLDLHKTVRGAVAKAGAEAVQNYDRGIGFLQMYLGCDPINDLFGPIGSNWAIYQLPMKPGENALQNSVLVGKLADAKKAANGLRAASYAIANLSQSHKNPNNQYRFKVQQTKVEDLTVTTLAGQAISPSWVIREGFVFVAPSPEGALAAASFQGASFSQSQSFALLQKNLPAGASPRSVQFIDLPATGATTYTTLRAMVDMLLMAGPSSGFNFPANPLPSVEAMQAEFSPIASVAWTDNAGFHTNTSTPFPGATMISGNGLVEVGTVALGVSVLLPSLNRARETANRVKCAADMREIATAAIEHAQEHKGQFPDDLGTLAAERKLDPGLFVCPSGDTDVPGNVNAASGAELAKWVNTAGDYIYLGKGLTPSSPAGTILLYEKEADHDGDGMNILYVDGAVRWHPMDEARQLIQAQTGAAPIGGKNDR
ncbi:MAG TPA: hypothetical protein VF669_13985 [Tepidisphaeraceae bacterium]|jgi:prepilin-type processing-associated H-X9-DG protein